ncbi:MAG: glycosyltransferase [Candidatus Competibacterales bacterium]
MEFPLIDHAVDGALGAVVHVPMAFDHLEPLGLCPLLEQPLPYPPGPAPAPPPPLGSREPLRLIAFGYMGINRRLEGIFQAMATFDQPERLQLDLYGELYDPGAVADLVTHWQLDDRVTLHGFVPEAHLDAALAASHLALNLRYPSMGEASGSQLRIFDRARGSLVTRTGWYATLPLDAVGFVDPDPQREVMDLHRHWRQLLADPRALATMGAAGRRHLETHHCPEAYVDGLLALLPHAVRWRTGWAGRWLTRRAGEELAAWGLTRRALDMERLTSLCGGMWPEVGATSRGQRAVRGE